MAGETLRPRSGGPQSEHAPPPAGAGGMPGLDGRDQGHAWLGRLKPQDVQPPESISSRDVAAPGAEPERGHHRADAEFR